MFSSSNRERRRVKNRREVDHRDLNRHVSNRRASSRRVRYHRETDHHEKSRRDGRLRVLSHHVLNLHEAYPHVLHHYAKYRPF